MGIGAMKEDDLDLSDSSVKGYNSDINNGYMKSGITIEYQEIDGLQMPTHIKIQNNLMSGMQMNIELSFLNFKIQKN